MTVYTLNDACSNLAKILEDAKNKPDVMIQGKNGELFSIQVVPPHQYHFPKIDLGLTRDEIVCLVRESREE